MKKRLKIGFFSFTCCEGCVVVFMEVLNKKFFEYKEKIEIVYLRALKTSQKIRKMDIAFVEGAISTREDIKKLEKIREKSKKLVALGSGAINGWPSNFRNKFGKKKISRINNFMGKQTKKVLPISDYVLVDDKIPGCPVLEEDLIKKIRGYLNAQL